MSLDRAVKDRLFNEVRAEIESTHVVIAEEDLRELLENVATYFLADGFGVARTVIEAVVKGGSISPKALTALDYAAGDGGIMEVAKDQAKNVVSMLPLLRKDAQK